MIAVSALIDVRSVNCGECELVGVLASDAGRAEQVLAGVALGARGAGPFAGVAGAVAVSTEGAGEDELVDGRALRRARVARQLEQLVRVARGAEAPGVFAGLAVRIARAARRQACHPRVLELVRLRTRHAVLRSLVQVAACCTRLAVRRCLRTGQAVRAACTAERAAVDELVRVDTSCA